MKSKIKLLIACLLPIVFWGCWEISDGERAGIVTKFSHKGAIFQTYEGELHYAGENGTIVADSWRFSIDNSRVRNEDIPAMVAKLEEAQKSGKRVKIKYREEMVVGCWRADTCYLIQSVEFVN